MEQIEIVQAGTDDLETLMQWRMEVLRHVFALPAEADTAELEQENHRYYEQQLSQGGHTACFAKIDGVIVGCGGVCFYDEMPSPDNPDGRCAYLMNIYCREAYRKRGVGRAVVRWLTGYALGKGIRKIYLETTDEGRKLYESTGFREMKDMMHIAY